MPDQRDRVSFDPLDEFMDDDDVDFDYPFEARAKLYSRRDQADGVMLPNIEVIRTTEAALLVRGPGLVSDPFSLGDGELWIPRSQVELDSPLPRTVRAGERGTLKVSAWFAEQKKMPGA